MDYGTISGANSLESAINTIWAGNALLAAAVPADRLITGRVPPSEQMPYVRLEPAGGTVTQRTNASLYATQRVNFHIWTDTFDSGRAIAPLIRNAFASNSFNWGNGAVLDMKSDGPPLSRQTNTPEIKAWQTTLSFTCATWHERQDTYAKTSSSGD